MKSNTDFTLIADFSTRQGGFTVSAEFEVGSGITALFGPSGSGKSLTLATIAGLLRPFRGVITLGDVVLADVDREIHVRTQDRSLGMVFQNAALLPHRTPVDNVAVAIRGCSRAERRARAESWLDRVHAVHLKGTPTGGLSGGEQQRVALARALAGEPRLLLVDEPFSALDRSARVSMRQLIRELADEHQLAVLLVTHDSEDLTELADGVVLFEPGRTKRTYDLRAEGRGVIPQILGFG